MYVFLLLKETYTFSLSKISFKMLYFLWSYSPFFFLNILDIGVNAYVSVDEKWRIRSKKTDYIKGYF